MLLKCPDAPGLHAARAGATPADAKTTTRSHGYTLKAACPACGRASVRAGPARYSPEDRYGAYRRRLRALAAKEAPP